jgi:antitoxin HicB
MPDNEGMSTYGFVIEQDEDGVYVASCPALPGCITQGRTLDEVRANVREALEVYIETLRESGQEIPPPRDVQVQMFDIAV